MKVIKIVLCFLFLTLVSCIDQIDLVSPLTKNPILIIDGKIVKTKSSVYVIVKTVLGATADSPARTVKAREVLLVNEFGSEVLLDDLFNGSWELRDNPTFPIDVGGKYKIRVTAIDNEIYESEFVELYNTSKVNTLNFELESGPLGKGNVKMYVNTNVGNNPSSKFFKWEMIETYKYTDQILGQDPGKLCYVSNKIDRLDIALFDGRKKLDNQIIDFLLSTRNNNYKFSEGYYLTVIQESINELSFDYFSSYNNLVKRDGDIYETPAGKLPSNMVNTNPSGKPVLGYFYAVTQDTARIFIEPTNVGSPSRQCPSEPTETSICGVRSCCDCLKLNGSSLNKPHFWK